MAEQQRAFEIGKDGVGTVVLGYDGTPASIHAAAWAAGLVRREHGSLVIVHVEVLSGPAYWTALGGVAATEAAAQFIKETRDEAGPILAARGIPWEILHGQGEPAQVLESIAEEYRADCIVVGRSRRRGILGSVPRSLLAHASRPVIVVP